MWTVAIVVTKIITVEISPFIIVPLQMLLGTLLLFSYFIILRKPINLNSFYSGVIFGLIAPGMAFSFFMFASTKTDALSMIVFWSLLPLLTPIYQPTNGVDASNSQTPVPQRSAPKQPRKQAKRKAAREQIFSHTLKMRSERRADR